jgi:ubiquinone/menaquinone biosynthesis C-methylase UbiE
MDNRYQSMEQVKQHYDVEKALASQLMRASRDERRNLYSSLYNKMFESVPFHPQLVRKASPEETLNNVNTQMKVLQRFLTPNTTFLEVGPGDCSLSFAACRTAKQVYGLDVSDEITKSTTQPANFKLILSDGSSVPLLDNSVDLAYSNQLMEHLHPDDAMDQLRNIYRALAPGGAYVCITPNRLNGPHDVSRYYDRVSCCFHLKEYTTGELAKLFKQTGFSQVKSYVGARGKFWLWPVWPLTLLENVLDVLPWPLKSAIARNWPLRAFMTIQLIGFK